MARYNTAPQTLVINGATALTYAFTGGIISLTGTSDYTVTLVSPVFFPGSRQTFYNATSGMVTLSTAAGQFRGNGVDLGTTIDIPTNSTYVLTSDGADYVLTSALAGTTVFELPVTFNAVLNADGPVELNPEDANVTISPTGSGTVAISPAGLVAIQPGGNVTIQPTGASTLTLNTSGGALTIGSASVPTVVGGNLTATGSGRAVTLSPSGAGTVSISPGGNTTIGSGGTLAISSSTAGTISNMSIGSTNPNTGAFTSLTSSGSTTFTANTASTSTTSGTLVVTGGLGVSGAIYAGSLQSTAIGSTTRSTGAFTTLTSNSATTFTANTASTNTTSGTLVVTGGIGVSGAIYAGSIQNTAIGSTTRSTGAFTTLTANSTTTITATTASTTTASGALVVSGGVGIAGALYAGSIQNTPIGATTANTGRFTTLTTTSTVTLSPASANVAISPTGTGTVTISPAGALTINPSTAGTINNMSIGATTRSTGAFTTLTSNNTTTFTQNSGATSTTTGTLRVTGGVGISERLYAGSIQATPIGSVTRSTALFTTLGADNTVSFTQNSAATSTTTGTLRVTGGVGVNGSLWAANVNSTGGSTGIIGYLNQTATATLADIDRKYIVSNTAAITLTLPNSSTDGRTIILADGNNFGSFNVTVGRGTRTIGGLAENLILNVPGSYVELVYRGGDWKVFTF
jgi:hypothetical protein